MKVFNNFKDAIRHSRKGEFLIFYRGVLFPFKWDFKGSDKTVFFFPGRTAREKKAIPVFQRSSYFDNINANAVSCFDPTLFWSDSLALGWYQGRGNTFYCNLLGDLIAKVAKAFKTKNSDVFLYGTSGGGIPGFNVAKKIPKCTLYVSNIQTDASKYHYRSYKKMIQVSYPKLSEIAILENMKDRISVDNIDGCFNLIYSQNKSDSFHYENHFKSYITSRPAAPLSDNSFLLYDDPETGHNPLPRNIEINIINCMLAGEDVKKFLPKCEEIISR